MWGRHSCLPAFCRGTLRPHLDAKAAAIGFVHPAVGRRTHPPKGVRQAPSAVPLSLAAIVATGHTDRDGGMLLLGIGQPMGAPAALLRRWLEGVEFTEAPGEPGAELHEDHRCNQTLVRVEGLEEALYCPYSCQQSWAARIAPEPADLQYRALGTARKLAIEFVRCSFLRRRDRFGNRNRAATVRERGNLPAPNGRGSDSVLEVCGEAFERSLSP